MPRPKLANEKKRIKMNLTVSPEIKEMSERIRIKKNISMSIFFENYVKSEYRKMVKRGEVLDNLQLSGQLEIKDIEMNIGSK